MNKIVFAFAAVFFCVASNHLHAQSFPTYAQSAPVSAMASTVTPQVQQLQLQGIANTLIAYPSQSEAILKNYIGVDTAKIDLDQFMEIVNRGNYQQVYNEVSVLSANRDAFNNGTFTDVSYYKMPVAMTPEQPVPLATAPVTPAETVDTAGTSTPSSRRSWLMDTNTGAVVVGTAVTAGLVAAAAGGGGGSSGNNGNGIGNSDDTFNRASLPDQFQPESFIDTEFGAYNLNALDRSNAQYAYAKGLTGAGVKIGFHDFFLDDSATDTELNSRILYRNLNIPGDTVTLAALCAYDPSDCDHGGNVMAYAANARDNNGTMGVAYQAGLLMNSDNAGSATILADQGADIINFSCGGCANLADLQYIAGQNILMTSATGNDGNANPDPSSPAIYASQLGYNMLAVTSVDVSGGMLFNPDDRCGTQKQFCLSAFSDSGTSYAAPQVAGAAALIKDGWSFLTASEIGQILLYSARDIGVTGVDDIYGHGLLDIQAAVNPVGDVTVMSGNGQATGFAASTISQNQNTAFGDAFSASQNARGHVVAVDSFGRDFAIKPRDNLAVVKSYKFSPETMRLFGQKNDDLRIIKVGDKLSMTYNSGQSDSGNTNMASYAEYDVNPATKLKLGFATDMSSVETSDIQQFNKFNFISNDAFRNGFVNFSDNNQVFHQSVQLIPDQDVKVKVKFSTLYSKNSNADYFMPIDNQVTSDFASSIIDTDYSPTDTLRFNFKNGVTHEFNSILGTKFAGSFDMENGADTYFTGVGVSYDVAPKWNIFGSYTLGATQAKPSGQSAFNDVSNMLSDSFAVTATRSDIIGRDNLSVSVGQPTRVRSGYASGLTQTVDRATGDVSVSEFQQSLVPTGQTLQFQAAYQAELSDTLDMNFAVEYEQQPYQQRNAPAETSALLKLVYQLN